MGITKCQAEIRSEEKATIRLVPSQASNIARQKHPPILLETAEKSGKSHQKPIARVSLLPSAIRHILPEDKASNAQAINSAK